jgi:bifunctional non-homologous end joining protein LigD
VLRSSPFIIPAQPAPPVRPAAGDVWLHEVKFDGYRCQLHKTRDEAVIFSKNGREFTNRFPGIRDALLTLPCKSAIIEDETGGFRFGLP